MHRDLFVETGGRLTGTAMMPSTFSGNEHIEGVPLFAVQFHRIRQQHVVATLLQFADHDAGEVREEGIVDVRDSQSDGVRPVCPQPFRDQVRHVVNLVCLKLDHCDRFLADPVYFSVPGKHPGNGRDRYSGLVGDVLQRFFFHYSLVFLRFIFIFEPNISAIVCANVVIWIEIAKAVRGKS